MDDLRADGICIYCNCFKNGDIGFGRRMQSLEASIHSKSWRGRSRVCGLLTIDLFAASRPSS
jgi:hypothetical protein